MQTLESIFSSKIKPIRDLKDFIRTDKFKELMKFYDCELIKKSIGADKITHGETTVHFRERRISITRNQPVFGPAGYISQVDATIATIMIEDKISLLNYGYSRIENERELVEDLKKIFFNED